MPVAVGTNAGAIPRLVYPGSKEREQFRIWGRAWEEKASQRREIEPQRV